ncbi:MAG: acyltransferase [Sphingomicrobium sp.]
MTRPQRPHFASIDALRGFAAFSVVLFHLGGAGLPKLASPTTTRLTSWGWTGVEVFFVISGFVIPFVMMKADYHWRDAGNFLARRFVRIWPPSAMLIALTIAQFVVINRMSAGHGGWTSLSTLRILANLAYIVPFTDQSWLNGILWTLSVEFQYYLFLALAFPLFAANRYWLVAACAASLLTPLLPFAESALFLKYAGYFAFGGLALLYREGRLGVPAMLGLLALGAAAATLELGILPTAFAAATTLIIAFIPIRSRVLIFLGTISYSLYLTHMLVASTSEFLLLRLFHPTSAVERLGAQMACLAIVILGAWLFYLLVERHFVSWSHHLAGAPRRDGEEAGGVVSAPGL